MLQEKNKKIYTFSEKKDQVILRSVLEPFDFDAYSQKEIDELVRHMRTMMVRNNGIGLSANQIGINARVFVAQLPKKNGRGYEGKFYAVFNPVLSKRSLKKVDDEEGCLSIPGIYGSIKRAAKVTLDGFDKNKRKVHVVASGMLARIFQHEVDHLNGKVFADSAKDLFTIEKSNY